MFKCLEQQGDIMLIDDNDKLIQKRLDSIFYIGIGLVFVALQGVKPLEVLFSYLMLFTGNLLILYVAFKQNESKIIVITLLMALAQISRVAI